MELRILGPFEVVDGGRAVDLGGGRQRALLALLALHGGEALSVDRIVDELWEEKPPETARKIIQVYVSALRKALGETAIATLGGGYALRLPRGTVDLERFEDLLDGARARSRPPRRRSCGRRSPSGAGRRSPTLPTTRSRRARSAGWRTCASPRSRNGPRPSWRPAAATRWWPSSNASCARIRFASGCGRG